VPPPAPSREEVEVRKLDALLALSDAKIRIVTPIPGAKAASKKGAGAGAHESEEGEGMHAE